MCVGGEIAQVVDGDVITSGAVLFKQRVERALCALSVAGNKKVVAVFLPDVGGGAPTARGVKYKYREAHRLTACKKAETCLMSREGITRRTPIVDLLAVIDEFAEVPAEIDSGKKEREAVGDAKRERAATAPSREGGEGLPGGPQWTHGS